VKFRIENTRKVVGPIGQTDRVFAFNSGAREAWRLPTLALVTIPPFASGQASWRNPKAFFYMAKARNLSRYVLPALLLLASGAVHAGAAEDAARDFLKDTTQNLGEVTVTVQAPEAALPPCADPQPFLPGQGQRLLGRVTVGVRCGDGQTRYLQARVTAIGHYWVAAETIPVGTLVTGAMLEARSGDLTELPRQAVLDDADAVGRVTTRTLAKGSVVQSSQLQAPWLIHRNRTVSVEAIGAGFRVTRQGEALQDGALGDTVRVRMSSRSVLTGVVAGNDLVKVTF